MKKIIEASLAIVLVCFSFYYTDQAVDFLRQNDPIMSEIERKKTEYETDPINAEIIDNNLIPGINGQIINEETTFEKMKQYGSFNEALIVFEEKEPEVTMNEYYDYYIEQGNTSKNMVSLVFKVNNNENITNIKKVLNELNIKVTFFIDGIYIKNNQEEVLNLAKDGHEIQVLNYDGRYIESKFQEGLDILENIINLKGKYCYAEYDNKEILELCSSKDMHTIIPTIQITTNPLLTVKEKLTSGSIIGLPVTTEIEEQLLTVINYINQRGYQLETVNTLLNESHNADK